MNKIIKKLFKNSEAVIMNLIICIENRKKFLNTFFFGFEGKIRLIIFSNYFSNIEHYEKKVTKFGGSKDPNYFTYQQIKLYLNK